MAKLVAIGDSITQGFTSGAVSQTDKSYPKMIADAMGLSRSEFVLPDFSGATGLPCNIEALARDLEQRYGYNIDGFSWIGAVLEIHKFLDNIEEYWERGPGSQPLPVDILFHNIAAYGFEVADCILTAAQCKSKFKDTVDNVLIPVPAAAREIAAYRVLNPSQNAALDPVRTQISLARAIKERDGAIDNLILALGANNCLPTVLELAIRETGDQPPGPFSPYTLWSTSAFQADYSALARNIDTVGATNVFVGNVPHVTIPPLTTGIMADGSKVLPPGERYFDYYKYFWVADSKFVPLFHKHLTKADAMRIDQQIDQYNRIIQAEVDARPNWHLVDIGGVLEQLAIKRNHGNPTYQLPPAIADLGVNYFAIDGDGKVVNGTGLMSLDGIHPTTSGYAILAQEFINVMRPFNPGIRDMDFAAIRAEDSLVSSPPRTLKDIEEMLSVLDKYFFFIEWFL